MKLPLFYKAGVLVRIGAGIQAGTIGTVKTIVLQHDFTPLILVSYLDAESGRFVDAAYCAGEVELLPSNSEAVLSLLRMAMSEDVRAAA